MRVNFGVTKPTDWIFFLDPDDYLEDYTLELMVKIQETHQADLISTKVKATSKYNDYSSHHLKQSDYESLSVITKEKALELMLEDKVCNRSLPVLSFIKKAYWNASHSQLEKSMRIFML